jgi:hypothetical protein
MQSGGRPVKIRLLLHAAGDIFAGEMNYDSMGSCYSGAQVQGKGLRVSNQPMNSSRSTPLPWPNRDLETVGPDGSTHKFFWSCEESEEWESPRDWTFRVSRKNIFTLGEDICEYKLKELPDGTVCTEVLENYDLEWAIGVGLSEAIFEIMYTEVGRTIVSSLREDQSDRAVSMWERFKEKGLARYDAILARYVFIPHKSAE